ncbi:MAG: protoporphyrinogen oxidase, partial [Halobacteriaceae archaeon]
MTIGIIGAGITGLSLNHYLHRSGVDSVVFESENQPGGAIKSDQIDDHRLERGPQRIRYSQPVRSLVADLDLQDAVIEGNDCPLSIYRAGKLRTVPLSLREAFTTDLLSWRAKLRVLFEPLTDPPKSNETVAEFLDRTLGSEVRKYAIGPIYGGLYGSDVREMYMRHSLGKALQKYGIEENLLFGLLTAAWNRDQPPIISFDKGLQQLPNALYSRHSDAIHLNTPVHSIKNTDTGYRIETTEQSYIVDQVILTTPAYITAQLLDEILPTQAEQLAKLNYNSLTLVYLKSDVSLQASGFQIPFTNSQFVTLGVTNIQGLFDQRTHYTCFMGGSKHPDFHESSDEKIQRQAIHEFETIM